MTDEDDTSRLHTETRLLKAGRPRHGWVNPPVSRGSTYLFADVETWRDTRKRREGERLLSYGARGTDSTFALEDALVDLEQGHRAKLYPTGQAAIATVLLALLVPGDHILLTEAVYEPVRRFCRNVLSPLGIDCEFFAADGSDIADRLRPQTRVVYVESPGSLLYEMVDLPAIAALAHRHGCVVVADNTWGSGLLYRPLRLGADISILAATKYLGGHSDVMMGAVVTNERLWSAIDRATVDLGQTVGADDAYLVLRGIRSMAVRLSRHEENAGIVARWLQERDEVAAVHWPGLESHPSHALWKRDCTGANGLLTVELHAGTGMADADRFVDALDLFGIGASWGGYESLALPIDPSAVRGASTPSRHGGMIRLHIGLEDPRDLIADLSRALTTLSPEPAADADRISKADATIADEAQPQR